MDKLLSEGKLLDNKGNLKECGFAYDLVREYNRKDIRGMKTRIKEWDYYLFLNEDYGVGLTIADNSYMSLVSINFMDFKFKKHMTKSIMSFFTFGKIGFPSSSTKGNVTYNGKNFSFQFLNNGKERHLICYMKNFTKYSDFKCDFIVSQTSNKSMVIATPFKKDRHFYYNQKINNLICNGTFQIGERKHVFKDALGVLDWGRGVWTYNNTWYWGSLSTKDKEGNYKGFNLGYGFGDPSAASENMAFFNKEAYKLNDVQFLIPRNAKGEYMYEEPWKIISERGDINMTFTPIVDRHCDTNLGVLCSLQHQVFGYFNGEIKCKKKIIKFENALGMAERVVNRW